MVVGFHLHPRDISAVTESGADWKLAGGHDQMTNILLKES